MEYGDRPVSAASRIERQWRAVLARYMPADLLKIMLDVNPQDTAAWATGDIRVTSRPDRTGTVFVCFEYAARTFGFDDAHEWFTTPNAGLGGITPAVAMAGYSEEAVSTLYVARDDSAFPYVHLAALDRTGTPRVALAGDWHSNLGHAVGSIERLAQMGVRTLLHLGDFSLWPGSFGARYIRRVSQACDEHDITIYITDGNHEDHSCLALIEPVSGIRWITDRIGYFERGHRWKWDNTDFVSLGGAPSVNRADLSEGRDWWPGEQITDADVTKASSRDHAHVMLTHDSPDPGMRTVEGIIRHNPQGWPREALEYAAEGRARLTVAVHAVRPLLLVHGHHHVVDRAIVHVPGGHDHATEIVSLACDGMGGNLAILDIRTLQVTIF